MDITDVIKPIKLLHGSHPDTAQTGSGCFMNVASYLNGDENITDMPTCVDSTVRVMMININDAMSAEYRQRLLPFVHRAMRTAGSARHVIEDRIVTMGRCASLMVVAMSTSLSEHAERRVTMLMSNARVALNHGSRYEAASYVGDALMAVLMLSRLTADEDQVVDILLRHSDKILPPAEEPSGEVLQRAEKLVATAEQRAAAKV